MALRNIIKTPNAPPLFPLPSLPPSAANALLLQKPLRRRLQPLLNAVGRLPVKGVADLRTVDGEGAQQPRDGVGFAGEATGQLHQGWGDGQ